MFIFQELYLFVFLYLIKFKIMDWKTAEKLLKSKIYVTMDLSPSSKFKLVKQVPPFKCKNYENVEGFRIQVGAKNEINIPLKMLELLFERSKQNNNTYNRAVFKENFARELNNKPCYVHSVGKLFEWAGIMKPVNSNTYVILEL